MKDCAFGNTGKPDTGVATLWFSCNYGAILTTYALYEVLRGMGKRPVLLDYSLLFDYEPFMAADNISRRFMRAHGIPCTEPLLHDGDYNALNAGLDTFVVGSDQVWRWRYTACCGLAYFLDYVQGDKRKLAYSSSFGIAEDERSAESLRRACCCLHGFDAVSVREKSGVDILRERYGVEAEWLLDPVFLCGMDVYDTLCAQTESAEQPYVLSYVLEPDEAILRQIAEVSATRGLHAVNMVDALRDFVEMQQRFGSATPAQEVSVEQWVQNIRNCEFFITDSFHGVCYALMFNRPFLCVAPPERGRARFDSLLGLVGLERCMLAPGYTQEEWEAAMEPIDWQHVNDVLEKERQKARTWLSEALTAPRPAWRAAMGDLVYEKLYAGMSEKTLVSPLEEKLQSHIRKFRMRQLPRRIRLKTLWHRFMACITRGKVRARHAARMQELHAQASYLQLKNNWPAARWKDGW